MVSSGKKARGKHRLDKFYHLAKEQGCVHECLRAAVQQALQCNRQRGCPDSGLRPGSGLAPAVTPSS